MTVTSFLFVLFGSLLAAVLGWATGFFGPNYLGWLNHATAGNDNGRRIDFSRLRSRKLSDISDDMMGLVLVLSVVVSVILIAHFAGQH